MRLDSVIKKTSFEPRPYQTRIIQKVTDKFNGRFIKNNIVETASKSIMIESPTGSGKTCMALLTAKAMQVEIPDLVVCWVAMRRNLLAQAQKENTLMNVNINNIHFVSMFDKHPESVIAARQQGKKILLVIDEAQHDAANSMAYLHNLLTPEFVLGMTATPFRTDRMKLCFDSVVKDAGIHSLIQDGYLSRYNHFTIPDWRAKTVADHYCTDPVRWGKSIFYFVNLEQCFKLHNIFRSRGIVSDVVTGNSDWEEQLDKFRNNETPCLINCMKLTEGFDEPSLHTAWVRPSGRGCTIQMGGRVFRKFPALPLKQIVQSKTTKWPMIRTASPEQQYLWQDDSWVSLTVNPMINRINQNARLAIATAVMSMPEWILKKRKVVKNTIR